MHIRRKQDIIFQISICISQQIIHILGRQPHHIYRNNNPATNNKNHQYNGTTMNLLHQTIQEYLTENHQNWVTTQDAYNSNVIHIVSIIRKQSRHIIKIFTNNQTIVSGTRYRSTNHTTYTESTLLQQLTNTIDHLEQL